MSGSQTKEVLRESFDFMKKMQLHFVVAFGAVFLPFCILLGGMLLFCFTFLSSNTLGGILVFLSIPLLISLFVCIVNELNYLYYYHKYSGPISFSLCFNRIRIRYLYYLSNFMIMIPVLLFFGLIFSLILVPILFLVEETMYVYCFIAVFAILFCVKIVFPFITYEDKNFFSALPLAIGLFFSKFKSTMFLFFLSIFIQTIISILPMFLFGSILSSDVMIYIPEGPRVLIAAFVPFYCITVGIIVNIWSISLFNLQYLFLKDQAQKRKNK